MLLRKPDVALDGVGFESDRTLGIEQVVVDIDVVEVVGVGVVAATIEVLAAYATAEHRAILDGDVVIAEACSSEEDEDRAILPRLVAVDPCRACRVDELDAIHNKSVTRDRERPEVLGVKSRTDDAPVLVDEAVAQCDVGGIDGYRNTLHGADDLEVLHRRAGADVVDTAHRGRHVVKTAVGSLPMETVDRTYPERSQT